MKLIKKPSTSGKKDILELFEENEKKVSLLYEIYSGQKGSDKRFWKNLSREEVRHAEIIRQSRRKTKKGSRSVAENRYSRQIVEYISKFIDREVQKAKKQERFSKGNYEIALRLEQSMVENKCFEIFSPQGGELKLIFRRLNRDTKMHVKIIAHKLKKSAKQKIPKKN